MPNSLPQVKNPITSRTRFRIIVIADSGSGIKFDSTIPNPEMLLTAVWLGARKKKTDAAIIATATVKIIVSFAISLYFALCFILAAPLSPALQCLKFFHSAFLRPPLPAQLPRKREIVIKNRRRPSFRSCMPFRPCRFPPYYIAHFTAKGKNENRLPFAIQPTKKPFPAAEQSPFVRQYDILSNKWGLFTICSSGD